MANSTISACPAPFVDLSNYPPTGGFLPGRFCGAYDAELSCCLPCPLEQWTYSDQFEHNRNIAYWFNVPALVCQVLLLLTFAVLPEEKSHRHYMSVGLCVSLILLEVSDGGRTLGPRAGADDRYSFPSSYRLARSLMSATMLSPRMICVPTCPAHGLVPCSRPGPWPGPCGVSPRAVCVRSTTLLTCASPSQVSLDAPPSLYRRQAYRSLPLAGERHRLGSACHLPCDQPAHYRRLLPPWHDLHTEPTQCLRHMVRLAHRLRVSCCTHTVRDYGLLSLAICTEFLAERKQRIN